MSDDNTITVVNRTGNTVWVGIDDSYTEYPQYYISGQINSGVLGPYASSGFVLNQPGGQPYSGSYAVGFINYPGSPLNGGTPAVIVYKVFPGSIVTLATEVGTRPDNAEPSE